MKIFRLFYLLLLPVAVITPTGSISEADAQEDAAAQFRLEDDDFYVRAPAQEALGQLLFFDPILSGNRDITCATCHHPLLGTGDGLSLPVGNAGKGFGPARQAQGDGRVIRQRVPRNAQPLFNIGAREFTTLFHDGRLMVDATQPGGFFHNDAIPFPEGLNNVLAAQAMLPVISVLEMAGDLGENPIAEAVFDNRLDGPGGAWDLLAHRLRANDEYVGLFQAAFSDVDRASDITLVHAANAIAAFEASAFRCSNSIFDQAIRGDLTTLSPKAWEGALLFYGAAGCAGCHSGALQTDHDFHAIGVPQIGPGRGNNQPGFFDGMDDFGREQVTLDSADRFRFRTPSLRQVTQTGPWGHDGAYNELETMVRHHLDALQALENYDTAQAMLPSHAELDPLDFQVHGTAERRQGIAAAIEIAPVALDDRQVGEIMAFLEILSDPVCVDMRRHIPARVPGDADF